MYRKPLHVRNQVSYCHCRVMSTLPLRSAELMSLRSVNKPILLSDISYTRGRQHSSRALQNLPPRPSPSAAAAGVCRPIPGGSGTGRSVAPFPAGSCRGCAAPSQGCCSAHVEKEWTTSAGGRRCSTGWGWEWRISGQGTACRSKSAPLAHVPQVANP